MLKRAASPVGRVIAYCMHHAFMLSFAAVSVAAWVVLWHPLGWLWASIVGIVLLIAALIGGYAADYIAELITEPHRAWFGAQWRKFKLRWHFFGRRIRHNKGRGG